MRGSGVLLLSGILAATVTVPALAELPDRIPVDGVSAPGSAPRLPAAFGFEPNLGQADPAVRFVGRGGGITLLLGEDEAVFLGGGSAVGMRMEGASPSVTFEAGSTLPGVSHYFLGNDPSRWRTGIPHHDRIRVRGIYPGIDMEWRESGGLLEYAFRVAPGTDPGVIRLSFPGNERPEIGPDGHLLLATPSGVLRHSRPIAWQESRNGIEPIRCRFRVGWDRVVRMEIGPRDPSRSLHIDPRVDFSTYFGGSGNDTAYSVVRSSEGNAVIAGGTASTDFPVQDALQETRKGTTTDLFFSVLDPTGSTLLYSTYVGGTEAEVVSAIATDGDDALYACGSTASTDFPTVDPFQGTHAGGQYDAFVLKMAADGQSLEYASFLGGSSTEPPAAIAVDGDGAAYVTGFTSSTNFPLQAAFQATRKGILDAYVTKVAPDGASLVYSTFLGGSGNEQAYGIAVDGTGACTVVGSTSSTDFPDADALQGSFGGGTDDAFVTRFNSAGSDLVYSTYFGGSSFDRAEGVFVDASGNAWVTGRTSSADFPVEGALQGSLGGGTDAFVAALPANGSALSFSTFLGGSTTDLGSSIVRAADGTVFVAGTTQSSNFPVLDAIQGTLGGSSDAFLARLASDGGSLVYSTFIGGSGSDYATGVALNGMTAYLAGYTTSKDFPVAAAYMAAAGSPSTSLADAFLVRITGTPLAPGGLETELVAVDAIDLLWEDRSADETGFRVERSDAGGPFATVAGRGEGATTYRDSGLAPDTLFTYRVVAFNGDGDSFPSNEVTRKTPAPNPLPPTAPTGLQAAQASPTRVDLQWTDNSFEENFFIVSRGVNGGLFDILGTPKADTVSFSDAGVLPGREYAYHVRAGNVIGTSSASNVATVTTPPSLDLLLVKGAIKDTSKIGKDSISLAGSLAINGSSPDGALDPVTDGVEVWLGGWTGQRILTVAAGDEGWRIRKGKAKWKSPRGSSTRAALQFVAETGEFKAKVKGLTFAAAPTTAVRITLGSADDAGTAEETWTERKAGKLKFP